MGVDLKLYPSASLQIGQTTEDCLKLNRDSDLFEHLELLLKTEGWDVPPTGVLLIGSNKPKTKDSYGNRLRFLQSVKIIKCIETNIQNRDWKNEAIVNYLKKFPKEWPIILYWD